MLSEEEKRRLGTYFGFLKREKAFCVGRNLESRLEKDEVCYLVFLPSCSDKSRDDLLQKKNQNVTVFDYQGVIQVHKLLGQKEIKAVGIMNPNLGKVILELLKKDMEAENKGGF